MSNFGKLPKFQLNSTKFRDDRFPDESKDMGLLRAVQGKTSSLLSGYTVNYLVYILVRCDSYLIKECTNYAGDWAAVTPFTRNMFHPCKQLW